MEHDDSQPDAMGITLPSGSADSTLVIKQTVGAENILFPTGKNPEGNFSFDGRQSQ